MTTILVISVILNGYVLLSLVFSKLLAKVSYENEYRLSILGFAWPVFVLLLPTAVWWLYRIYRAAKAREAQLRPRVWFIQPSANVGSIMSYRNVSPEKQTSESDT